MAPKSMAPPIPMCTQVLLVAGFCMAQAVPELTRVWSLQDDSLRGLLHGIYIGVSGILLKPMSGCFSLVSELCTGASGKIKAWGEDSHRRPPIGRIRPPRQFSALSADMGGLDPRAWPLPSMPQR